MYGRRESPRAPRPDLDAGWCAEESRSRGEPLARGPPREVEHEGRKTIRLYDARQMRSDVGLRSDARSAG